MFATSDGNRARQGPCSVRRPITAPGTDWSRHPKEGCAIWIITQDGFYSVTAYDPRKGGERNDAEELIVVRARVRADLERVSAWVGGDVIATPNADYPFRVIARREAWNGYLTEATSEIDYFNFKNRVTDRLGSFRHDVLMAVWSTLRRLQS